MNDEIRLILNQCPFNSRKIKKKKKELEKAYVKPVDWIINTRYAVSWMKSFCKQTFSKQRNFSKLFCKQRDLISLFRFILACQNSQPEWIELGDNGAVCYAPSRLGKLVLRVTGFPRIVQQQMESTSSLMDEIQEGDDSPFEETRHLYLGFHHPWDRDLWRSWLKKVRLFITISISNAKFFLCCSVWRLRI